MINPVGRCSIYFMKFELPTLVEDVFLFHFVYPFERSVVSLNSFHFVRHTQKARCSVRYASVCGLLYTLSFNVDCEVPFGVESKEQKEVERSKKISVTKWQNDTNEKEGWFLICDICAQQIAFGACCHRARITFIILMLANRRQIQGALVLSASSVFCVAVRRRISHFHLIFCHLCAEMLVLFTFYLIFFVPSLAVFCCKFVH